MVEQANITLRTARIGDLKLLQHWDQQPHVIASDADTTRIGIGNTSCNAFLDGGSN